MENLTRTEKPLEQKEAIFRFFTEHLTTPEGDIPTKNYLREFIHNPEHKQLVKAMKKAVKERIIAGILDGTIRCREFKKQDKKELRKYCSSMISNWFRRDSRYAKPSENREV